MHTMTPPAATFTQVEATYAFADSSAAWAFMRACDAAGLCAGYPELRTHRVSVLVRGAKRATATELAGAEPVEVAAWTVASH